MLDHLWSKHSAEAVVPVLHKYYLKYGRNIEVLLPQKESIRGIEIGESYLQGKIDEERLFREIWAVEGAAFCIDYNTPTGSPLL